MSKNTELMARSQYPQTTAKNRATTFFIILLYSSYLRYVDDIVRTVKGNPGVVLEAANKLHPNLQFTIEELDRNVNLAYSGLNVNVDSGKKVTCGWYQKPTDTGTILNFRGCAPLQ